MINKLTKRESNTFKNLLYLFFCSCFFASFISCDSSGNSDISDPLNKRWKSVRHWVNKENMLHEHRGLTILVKDDGSFFMVQRRSYKNRYYPGKWNYNRNKDSLFFNFKGHFTTLLSKDGDTGIFGEVNYQADNKYELKRSYKIQHLSDTLLHLSDHDSETYLVPYLKSDTLSAYPGGSNVDYTQFKHLEPLHPY